MIVSAFAKRLLPCNPHFYFARLAHQAAAARLSMAFDPAPFLRGETVIAAVAPTLTLTRVVPGVLRWCRLIHNAERLGIHFLRGISKMSCWPDLTNKQTRGHVMNPAEESWTSSFRFWFAFALGYLGPMRCR